MAQRISPYSVAEQSLALSSQGRGQGGMQRTSANPGPNAWNDPSGFSNPAASTNQDFINQRLAVQNIEQNTVSAVPQAGADAINQVREGVMNESDASGKAQEFANERLATMLYANQEGAAMMKLNGVMNSPDREAFEKDIATSKVMAMGLNPDLASA